MDRRAIGIFVAAAGILRIVSSDGHPQTGNENGISQPTMQVIQNQEGPIIPALQGKLEVGKAGEAIYQGLEPNSNARR